MKRTIFLLGVAVVLLCAAFQVQPAAAAACNPVTFCRSCFASGGCICHATICACIFC